METTRVERRRTGGRREDMAGRILLPPGRGARGGSAGAVGPYERKGGGALGRCGLRGAPQRTAALPGGSRPGRVGAYGINVAAGLYLLRGNG